MLWFGTASTLDPQQSVPPHVDGYGCFAPVVLCVIARPHQATKVKVTALDPTGRGKEQQQCLVKWASCPAWKPGGSAMVGPAEQPLVQLSSHSVCHRLADRAEEAAPEAPCHVGGHGRHGVHAKPWPPEGWGGGASH